MFIVMLGVYYLIYTLLLSTKPRINIPDNLQILKYTSSNPAWAMHKDPCSSESYDYTQRTLLSGAVYRTISYERWAVNYTIFMDSLKITVTDHKAVQFQNPHFITIKAVDINGKEVKLSPLDSCIAVDEAKSDHIPCYVRDRRKDSIKSWIPIDPNDAYAMQQSFLLLRLYKGGGVYDYKKNKWIGYSDGKHAVDSFLKAHEISIPIEHIQLLLNNGRVAPYREEEDSRIYTVNIIF